MRIRDRIHLLNQGIGWRIAGMPMLDTPNYSDEIRPDILGEDDRGELVAPAPTPEHWLPFKPWRLRHLRAALNSRRLGLINFMEFE